MWGLEIDHVLLWQIGLKNLSIGRKSKANVQIKNYYVDGWSPGGAEQCMAYVTASNSEKE